MDDASIPGQHGRAPGIDLSRRRVGQDDVVHLELLDHLSLLIASGQVT